MKIEHAKSRCCGASIQRWGGKRRRCNQCFKTWRIRPKKRGPKAKRPPYAWLAKALLSGHYLKELPRKRSPRSIQALTYRFRLLLQRVSACPSLIPPGQGPVVLLSDGLWFRFRKRRWVLYLTAFKPCAENRAYFGDPLVLPGYECARGWRQVFDRLPPDISKRICAWVVDNVTGIRTLASQKGWVLQLCHFHLIAQLQNRRGHWRQALAGHQSRERIYQSIRQLLEMPSGPLFQTQLSHLQTALCDPLIPSRLRMIGTELIRRLPHYRAYRDYAHWHLPTTTCTVESTGSLIRERLRRARNLRTPQSLQLWATALLRVRKSIACNGRKPTK